MEDCSRAIAMDPDIVNAYLRRVSIAFRLRDYATVLDDGNRLVALRKSETGGYFARGVAYFAAGKLEAAIAEYDAITEFAPDDPEAYLCRAATLLEAGGGERMQADYERYLALMQQPSTSRQYIGRAWAQNVLGRHAEALPDAERAIEIDPADASGYSTRAHVLEALGRNAEAVSDFNSALARQPDAFIEKKAREGLARLGALA
jgi:tetratricopeptide (TPR) repeat protein